MTRARGHELESKMREDDVTRTRAAGFSLVELMVAMVVTLVITGAVYGLIAGGQNAFRREPELAERQQNIRMAMDLIMKDIGNAGSGLPTFVQIFTPGLDACAACPMGPDNAVTDELEVITNSEARDTEPICRTMGLVGGNAADVRLIRDVTVGTNPVQPPLVVLPFTANGQWTLRSLVSVAPQNTPAFDCTAGSHTVLGLNQAGDLTGLNTPNHPCEPNGWGNVAPNCELVGLSFANIVRYRIRNDADGVPMLERWSSDAPNAFAGGAPQNFQILARGIENLQVQYLRADGDPNNPADWQDSAPVVTPADFASVVTQVRVLLAARSEAQNIAGSTTSQSGGDAIRGTLVSSASPRATLMNLTLEGGAPRWK
jgi:prepilin-type N-terminal cleavage/methylation domain-containing protein